MAAITICSDFGAQEKKVSNFPLFPHLFAMMGPDAMILVFWMLRLKKNFIYFNWRLITLQYCSGFCHTFTWVSHGCTCVPHPETPSHPSVSSQCTSFECSVSSLELGLVIYFTYGNIHVSMLVSQIISPSPSPTESKRLFFISVSFLLSRIQGHHYHLSKLHIYALKYCVGIFLSDLLHSV